MTDLQDLFEGLAYNSREAVHAASCPQVLPDGAEGICQGLSLCEPAAHSLPVKHNIALLLLPAAYQRLANGASSQLHSSFS